MLHKRVYPELKEKYASHVFILINGEGCISQAATWGMSLCLRKMNELNEGGRMITQRDWNKYLLNVREDPINGLSLECKALPDHAENEHDTAKPPQSATKISPNDDFHIASHWMCPAAE